MGHFARVTVSSEWYLLWPDRHALRGWFTSQVRRLHLDVCISIDFVQ